MPRRKQWTVLVYMAADNDLDDAGIADLLEMKKVGSTSHINVVAQFDRARGEGKSRRFYIRRGTNFRADSVAMLPETNTGTKGELQRFVRWGVENYPAHRHMLILWNHGVGWDDNDIYHLAGNRASLPPRDCVVTVRDAILFDDTSSDFLDNIEMRSALDGIRNAIGKPLDLVAFDACLMNMVEIVYQLRGSAEVIVGSEEVEPDAGWPYDVILRSLADAPRMSAPELGKIVVNAFVDAYRSDAVTQSAVRVAEANNVRVAVDAFSAAMIEAWEKSGVAEAIVRARAATQSYVVSDYVDLIHFCQRVAAERCDPRITASARNVIVATRKMIISSRARGATLRDSHGLSIYFPQRAVSSLYARLDFARDSIWGDFLKRYVASSTLEL